MKTIEWTRTGGRTHRVTIKEIGIGTGYDVIFDRREIVQPGFVVGFQPVSIDWSTLIRPTIGNCLNDQRGVLWGIFGSWP